MPILKPLEFKDCVVDGPLFRNALHKHSKDIKISAKKIKEVIISGEKLFRAMEHMQLAYKEFATTLVNCFNTDDADSTNQNSTFSHTSVLLSEGSIESVSDLGETEDDKTIKNSFNIFSEILRNVEESRLALLHPIRSMVMKELNELTDVWLTGSKTDEKLFVKDTLLFNQKVEKYVAIKSKESTPELEETMKQDRYKFIKRSLQYVADIHQAEELKKSKFVQTITLLMNMLHNFYHQAYEHFRDYQGRLSAISVASQRSWDTFLEISEDTKLLREKLLQTQWETIQAVNAPGFREGYVFVPTKKTVATQWIKHFCVYSGERKSLLLFPYSQGRTADVQSKADPYVVKSCTRRASDSIDRRFCFDVEVDGKHSPLTLQGQTLADMTEWLYFMGGKEPIYADRRMIQQPDKIFLNEHNFNALCALLEAVESKDLQTPGLYRVSGVNSKIRALIQQALTPFVLSKSTLENMELNTLTGAVKYLLRSLDEPLLTYRLHDKFIAAIKLSPEMHVPQIQQLLHLLPGQNLKTLRTLMFHLAKVATHSEHNSMPPSNLAIVFAPTLLRSDKETVAAIMNTKFSSLVVQLMIEQCSTFFGSVAARPTSQSPKVDAEKAVHSTRSVVSPSVTDISHGAITNASIASEDETRCSLLIEPVYSTPVPYPTVIQKSASSQELRPQLTNIPLFYKNLANLSQSAERCDGPQDSSSRSSKSSLVNRIPPRTPDKHGRNSEATHSRQSATPPKSQSKPPEQAKKYRRRQVSSRRTLTAVLLNHRAKHPLVVRNASERLSETSTGTSTFSAGNGAQVVGEAIQPAADLKEPHSTGSRNFFNSVSARHIRRPNFPDWVEPDTSACTTTHAGVQADTALKPARPPRPHLPVSIRRKSLIASLNNASQESHPDSLVATHRVHMVKQTPLVVDHQPRDIARES